MTGTYLLGIRNPRREIQNPESKTVLLDDENTNNLHFSKGLVHAFGQKLWNFYNPSFKGNISRENVFGDVLDGKRTFSTL